MSDDGGLRSLGEIGPHAYHDRQAFVMCGFRNLRSDDFAKRRSGKEERFWENCPEGGPGDRAWQCNASRRTDYSTDGNLKMQKRQQG